MYTSSEKNMGARALVLRLNEGSEIIFFLFLSMYMSVVSVARTDKIILDKMTLF